MAKRVIIACPQEYGICDADSAALASPIFVSKCRAGARLAAYYAFDA
ncbi:MAG TPA: hypothetical protein VFH48_11755 [Chloroflexota bacterium]|nr:hypothetical protein [Chloroflexota bacterium]